MIEDLDAVAERVGNPVPGERHRARHRAPFSGATGSPAAARPPAGATAGSRASWRPAPAARSRRGAAAHQRRNADHDDGDPAELQHRPTIEKADRRRDLRRRRSHAHAGEIHAACVASAHVLDRARPLGVAPVALEDVGEERLGRAGAAIHHRRRWLAFRLRLGLRLDARRRRTGHAGGCPEAPPNRSAPVPTSTSSPAACSRRDGVRGGDVPHLDQRSDRIAEIVGVLGHRIQDEGRVPKGTRDAAGTWQARRPARSSVRVMQDPTTRRQDVSYEPFRAPRRCGNRGDRGSFDERVGRGRPKAMRSRSTWNTPRRSRSISRIRGSRPSSSIICPRPPPFRRRSSSSASIVGTPGELTYAKDIHRYFDALAKASPRSQVLEDRQDAKKAATWSCSPIADEATIAKLDKYKGYLHAADRSAQDDGSAGASS